MGNATGREKKAQKCKKDVFLTERTQCFIGNKGLRSRRMSETSALLMPNERKLKPKRAKNCLLLGLEAQFEDRKSAAGRA
jgi:hypothetical protein